MFELITGTVLFSRDMNFDKLTSDADRAALLRWTTLNTKQLRLVFKSAENVSKAQKLFAQV